MKQPEDNRTADWVGEGCASTWPRLCALYCRECKTHRVRVLVHKDQGPPPCLRCGALRPAILEEFPVDTPPAVETGKRKPRGAYAGAVKIGAGNQAQRARTKLSQAEFSKLAGVSERTLRSWERGDTVSAESVAAIVRALQKLGAADLQPRRPARYYDAYTGQSWSGRGLMPRWMRAELDKGRRLADFERPA